MAPIYMVQVRQAGQQKWTTEHMRRGRYAGAHEKYRASKAHTYTRFITVSSGVSNRSCVVESGSSNWG